MKNSISFHKTWVFPALVLLAWVLIESCTPRAIRDTNKTDTTTEVELPPAPEKTTNERGCEMYAGDRKKAEIAYNLYRDNFKLKSYEEALPYWRLLFNEAPGLREQTFKDGDVMYKKMMEEENNPARKAALFDTLMMVYDQRAICWGKSAFLSGKKAFAYYKYYPEQEEKILDFAEKAVLNGGNETTASTLQVYFRMLVKKYIASQGENIEEVSDAYQKAYEIIEHNLGNGAEKDKQKYEDAKTEIEEQYAQIDDSRTTLSDCPTAIAYYEEKIQANPNDLALNEEIFKRMLKYKCYDSQMFREVVLKLVDLKPESASPPNIAGNIFRVQKNCTEAFRYYEMASQRQTDPIKKAKLKMKMATMKAYECGDKSYSEARKYALEAAQLNPNWGTPYLLIGRMYASSGSLCGPGTGFESQKVIWPAMDMWNKAKQVDPSSADEAQKMINKYYEFLPTRGDLFQRSIDPGSPYKIGCWIGGTSAARAK